MYNYIKKLNKEPDNVKAYKDLFKRLKKYLPKDLSFSDINDRIDLLYRRDVQRPGIVDDKVLLDGFLQGDSSKVLHQTRVRLKRFKNVEHVNTEIAEILIQQDQRSTKIKRRRLRKATNLDVQLDRLLKGKVYVSQHHSIYGSIKSLLLVTLLQMNLAKNIDQRLLNSMDFSSLVRTSMSMGGEEVRIPTYNEVEAVIASAYYFYLRNYEGVLEVDARKKVKDDLQIDIGYGQLNQYYNSLLLLYSKEMKRDSTPIVKMLGKISNLIQDIQEKSKEAVMNINSSEEFLSMYKDVNKTFMALSRGMSKL